MTVKRLYLNVYTVLKNKPGSSVLSLYKSNDSIPPGIASNAFYFIFFIFIFICVCVCGGGGGGGVFYSVLGMHELLSP